ncbi:MAG: ADP-ribosylglycohydrolase family protein [Phaeodactylibacter sp.]|nr:ADP-ribosylglycohydrolase family protein [Phaeodactylibacter sp.]
MATNILNFIRKTALALLLSLLFFSACQRGILADSGFTYKKYEPSPEDKAISRTEYLDKLYGFWLGQCIANWTGLITEMDKIGGEGKDGRGAGFYSRENWGGPDEPNIWGSNNLSDTIGFYFEGEGGVWGADDDTDIEYLYQHLLYTNKTTLLTGEQIAAGWLKHIKAEEENYLWVSNQQAFDLMREGLVPPATGHPENNPHYEMIDAQLTTEIFGLFAPARPDVALEMARLPIQTTARENAQWIAEFYVIMHALASSVDKGLPIKEQVLWMADEARQHLPGDSYSAKMYDFVKSKHQSGATWEEARDALHEKYQVRQEDGYEWATKDTVCNGCFAAGINFGASIISLLYGEGEIKETIKIGALAGWDSDNPTATWGGLLGFMLGKEGVEEAFGRKFADKFNIHRTRVGFPNGGINTFHEMAKKGVFVVDRVVQEEMGGGVDFKEGVWYVPANEQGRTGQ